VGSSFAGLQSRHGVGKRLDGRHEIVVISDREKFIFIPSLIWVPFGKRTGGDISFPLPPPYRRRGIRFIRSTATHFDLEQHVVETTVGPQAYDYLLVATGAKPDYEMLPGLGPEHGHSVCICTLEHAEEAAKYGINC
jgi:sulfide:quinone oxidoreductase